MVYVQNISGLPLMPCTEAKARHLLKEHKAEIVNYTPFTIRLLFVVDDETQPVTLGVDAGYKSIGLSATTETKVLYEAEVEGRNDITKLLTARREMRRARRNHKTRYRAPRFDNRIRSKRKVLGSFLSVKNCIDTHMMVIKNVRKLLPITKIVVEVVAFDTQKIKNPDIKSAEYQREKELDFWKAHGFYFAREIVLWRDGYKCRHCRGTSRDNILEAHHLVQHKFDEGLNSTDNLITLCRTCHEAYHRGESMLDKSKRNSRAETFMSIMCWDLVDRLKAKYYYDVVDFTYGYITKAVRIANNLPKNRCIDARCISGNATAKPNGKVWRLTKHRSHNRQIHKCTILKGGVRQLNQCPRVMYGFRLFDIVSVDGRLGYITSRRTRGAFKITWFDNNTTTDGISYKRLKLVRHSRNMDIS